MELRALQKSDIEGMLEWMHDPLVNCYFRFDAEHMTAKDAERFILSSIEKARAKQEYHFAVADGDNYMGTISLKNIDWIAGTAEYAIALRRQCQGKGIGTEATLRLLRFAFMDERLNRVYLSVLADHDKAIRLYEKCGFVLEGEFREHVAIKGQLKNWKWYGILRKEYIDESSC